MRLTGLMALVLVAASLLGAQTRPIETRAQVIARVHDYTHAIDLETVTDSHSCSATAIGPHALLTATHCELGTDEISIDSTDPVEIKGIARDKADHTIYYVDATFKTWATVNTTLPNQGDIVFLFGNPGKYEDYFRQGYIVHIADAQGFLAKPDDPSEITMDLNIWHGDSGSGVFNEYGELITVVSVGETLDDKSDNMTAKFATGLEIKFTPELLAKVQKLGTK